jgi:hypothetical protein
MTISPGACSDRWEINFTSALSVVLESPMPLIRVFNRPRDPREPLIHFPTDGLYYG